MQSNMRTQRITLAVTATVLILFSTADADAQQNRRPAPSSQTAGTPGGTPAGVPPVYAPYPARPEGPLDPVTGKYKIDAIDFLLMPGDAVEYKYRLAADATMLYMWTADAAVRFDFHTVPDGRPVSASERFEAGEVTQASGVYKAPYAGLHGWWWQNNGTKEVNIRIYTAGFYSEARMFAGRPDGEPFDVKDPPAPEQ